jgi:prepilin-type N-terminal cleavage/methylation domain-containing protein
MKKPGFTLAELLVALAVIAVLIGLLLPAVQKVRESAARSKCQNNLKQIALATHAYESSNGYFPAGATPAPGQLSVQALLLPYLEQAALYQRFDPTKSSKGDPANYAGRIQEVATYICPADPSEGASPDEAPPLGMERARSGRCSYYGNAGAHALWRDIAGAAVKPPALAGVFGHDSRVRVTDIADGLSNTALFAEVKRGAAPAHDSTDVALLPAAQWNVPGTTAATNPNNLAQFPQTFAAACAAATLTDNSTGLKYYYGSPTSALYTHTVPPNYRGRDCMIMSGDQFHLAARSYHAGGVNVVLAGGSVRFIPDTIPFDHWKALGTRAGGDIVVLPE